MRLGNGMQMTRQARYPAAEEEPGGFDANDYAGLELWLRADDLSAIADGDPVAAWADASAAGNDATGAGSSRPTKRTASGLHYVEFDGTDDNMPLADVIDLSAAAGIFVVMSKRNSAHNANILMHDGSTFPMAHYGADWYHGVTAISAATFADVVHVWATLVTGGAGSRRVDGVEVSTSMNNDASSQTASSLGLPAAPGTYDLYEIIVYSVEPTGAEVDAIEAYIFDKYGITPPTP